MSRYTVFSRLPEQKISVILSDAGVPTMRAAMRRLNLRQSSSSASTRLKKFAKQKGIDLSRFKAGVRDQNLIGKRFGKLVVIKENGRRIRSNGDKLRLWLCLCACGLTVSDTTAFLNSGERHSCGKCTVRVHGNQHPNWKGFGKMPGRIWQQICRNAAVRGWPVEITGQQAWHAFEHQNGKCALSGTDIEFRKNCKVTASLDRKRPDAGYTLDNIQWVHKIVNKMKQNLDEADFVLWCKFVANFKA